MQPTFVTNALCGQTVKFMTNRGNRSWQDDQCIFVVVKFARRLLRSSLINNFDKCNAFQEGRDKKGKTKQTNKKKKANNHSQHTAQ